MRSPFWAVIPLFLLASPALSQYTIGDSVANFTLLDSDSNFVSLSDFPDNIVFLVFWEPG